MNIKIKHKKIRKEAKKYQQSTVNKMGIERTAFIKGALYVLKNFK